MIVVEALRAEHGDCLWIEWDDGPRRRRMLIDGGPGRRDALAPGLADRFERQPVRERRFELVVSTHIDDDHITGLLPLMTAPPPGFTTKEVWFNADHHLGADDTLGVRAANELAALLRRKRLSWNTRAGGDAIVVDEQKPLPTFPLQGGLTLTLLSPTRAGLRKLRKSWRRSDLVAQEPGDVLGAAEDARLDATSLPELAARPYRRDRSEANGSSIAFLAEHRDGSRVLFGADAHAETLVLSLRRLWHGSGYPVALCKVPHHGSAHNVSPGLVRALDCRHWLFSTNGGRGHAKRWTSGRSTHPSPEAVARILAQGPQGARDTGGAGTTFWFNHRSPSTLRYGGDSLRSLGLRSEYPADGAEGITVVVENGEVTRGTP
ncbi:hypothetical protein ABZ871_36730 [Streptomyces populi]